MTLSGLDQAYVTAINQGFAVWCCLTPVLGAILADQYLGRPKTISYASTVYFAGLLILLSSSFPSFSYGASLFGLVTATLFIGFGTGGIRPNVN
jgi:POT family proton-dependent oligopeptide transporter